MYGQTVLEIVICLVLLILEKGSHSCISVVDAVDNLRQLSSQTVMSLSMMSHSLILMISEEDLFHSSLPLRQRLSHKK